MQSRRLSIVLLTIVLCATAVHRVPEAQSTGLVAAYSFDETAGATVNDASGNGNAGTIFGAARTSSGRFGAALMFDGVDDWVTVASATSLNLTSRLTLEAWVRPTQAGDWQTAVMKEAPGDLRYALYSSSETGTPSGYLQIGTHRSVYSTSPLPLGAWSHVAMTYDGANIRLYVNGTQVGISARTGNVATSTSPLRIGGNAAWG
jgi:hypothetical protein